MNKIRMFILHVVGTLILKYKIQSKGYLLLFSLFIKLYSVIMMNINAIYLFLFIWNLDV